MKRAVVTGAGKRLGRAMALYLAGRGYDVAVHYSSSETEAQQVVADIQAMGQKAVALQADILQEEQVERLLPQAREALGGPITCLINNASIFEPDSVQTASRSSWDRHFGSNLRAPFLLLQSMAEQNLGAPEDEHGEPLATGLVVNMIDQRVRKLTPTYMTYTLAKSALWTLTQTAAQALAPAIRVNAIGPGPTLVGPRQKQVQFDQQRRSTVLQRGTNPAEISAALGYFLDAPAVTGQLICVDAGQHLAWQTPDVAAEE
jgi:NAD(P)-dependent dehydrogenase (short-subunit alcohol dehydrogenase family)